MYNISYELPGQLGQCNRVGQGTTQLDLFLRPPESEAQEGTD